MDNYIKHFLLLTMIVGVVTVFGATTAYSDNKVKVCHFPPGNSNNFHTLIVSENALAAHLAHGDFPGSCFEYAETLCDDGNACTIDAMNEETETCFEDHPPVNCDDSNPCTTETCDPANGCQYAPIVCDDGAPCTVDACNPTDGLCINTPVDCGPLGVCLGETGLCDHPCDGFSCEPIDQCHAAGECTILESQPICLDGDLLSDGTPCDDGDNLTNDDQCIAGLCQGTVSNPIVIQPGPEQGIDAYVTNIFQTTYEAYKNWIRIGGWGDLYYGLIRFNLEGLPAVAQHAVIRLYNNLYDNVGSFGLMLDRCDSYWDEETINWSIKPSYTEIRLLPTPAYDSWYEIDITDLYNEWQAGAYPNYGIQLRPSIPNPWNNWVNFFSSDYTENPSLRPQLVIYN